MEFLDSVEGDIQDMTQNEVNLFIKILSNLSFAYQ